VRLVFILVFMMILASFASAAVEKTSTGPFNVSFDLNTTMNHNVGVEPIFNIPEYTVYRVSIATNNSSRAEIGIVEFTNLTDSTLILSKNFETLKMITVRGYPNNVSAFDLKIEGKDGFLITALNGLGQRLYHALYWLDSKDCECGPVSLGTITVGVISSYPPDITKNLIDTLHVERTGKVRPRLGKLF
jgi:hypothetical protein